MTRCVALQVVTLQGLLERLPGAATHALLQHELQEAAAERATLDAPFLARYEDLNHQFLTHKRGLHPNLAHPNRCMWLRSWCSSHAQGRRLAPLYTTQTGSRTRLPSAPAGSHRPA